MNFAPGSHLPHRRGGDPDAAWLRLGLQDMSALDAQALSHWLKLAATFQRLAGRPLGRGEAPVHPGTPLPVTAAHRPPGSPKR